MKNLYLQIIMLFTIVNSIFSQNPDNHWQLGVTDVNFSTNPPTTAVVANAGNYGKATISDNNGNLLFYTNGSKVWNKNHLVMQNGTAISGADSQPIQPVVIVPYPGNANKYIIISSNGESFLGSSFINYTYSIVDFTNNSLGELVAFPFSNDNFNQYSRYLTASPNSPIGGRFRPLTIAKKSDGTGYWAIVQLDKSLFSYEITSAGFNQTPVVSDFSSTYIGGTLMTSSMFRMSQDYTNLYSLEYSDEGTDSFLFYKVNFNSISGVFSNIAYLNFVNPGVRLTYFELSKDDSKAYFISNPLFSGSTFPKGQIVAVDLLNLANARILAELSNPTNFPDQLFYLQRNKYGDLLASSFSIMNNRNKYIHKIENQNSFANATVSLNWLYLNNNIVNSLPQLLNTIPVSPTVPCGNTNLNISAAVVSGSSSQQATNITASNVISVGAGGIYHAENAITFTLGFNAVAGSTFRGYIEGCTGVFVGKNSVNSKVRNELNEKISNVLYPNPNNGSFYLNLNTEMYINKNDINIAVYDASGKNIFQENLKYSSIIHLSLTDIKNGFYILKISSGNHTENIKFMKN